MKTLINMSEAQHKQKLQRRHQTGTIYEYLYRFSLVFAVAALLTLLIQISNQAFGPTLNVPVVSPSELSDQPIDELDGVALATILVDEMGDGKVNLFRDAFGRLEGTAFVNQPVSEAFNESVVLPSELDVENTSIQQLSDEDLIYILERNASQAQLLSWVDELIIGEDVILEWSWLTNVFDNDRLYTESAAELAPDIARNTLRSLEDDYTAEDIAAGIAPAVGEEEALNIANTFMTASAALLETDWRVDRRRIDVSLALSDARGQFSANDVTNELEQNLLPDVAAVMIENGIAEEVAFDVADRIAGDIVDDNGLEEISNNAQRDMIAGMMEPAFADTLRANEYPEAEVAFRSWLTPRFLVEVGQNSTPELATLRVAILGSVWVMIITMLTSFPLGVGAAIYLEEYATDNALNRLIETNIRNLAGVPSIIYGLLGLAVFARALGSFTSGAFFMGIDDPTLNGRTVMSAGLTLALLILPVIIINAQEAIRAVPSSIREASYGLGATKWQTIWRQVLPTAVPGILTGTILAFSRAVGETAPLIVVGAASSISQDPSLFSKFTVIPIQIFQWTEESRPEYQHLAAAAIIVLLVLLIVLNSTAIALRNRYTKSLS